jgi:hypothetical protein
MTSSNEVYSAMAGGKPYKTYKKQILGKVYVTVLNMLTGTPTPEGVILTGDPRKDEPSTMYDVFSEQEDYFFRKMNKTHLDSGTVIEIKRAQETEAPRTFEQYTDEELREIIAKPFGSLRHVLNSTTSVALLSRIKDLAGEMDKSEKVIRAIESRLSEVQESPQLSNVIEEEL